MSFTTGTAADYNAFVAALDTFLTTDAALVAASQNWVLAWTSADGTQKVFKGPGLDGLGSVYVGRQLVANTANSSYLLRFRAFQGIIATATDWSGLLNPQPFACAIYLDSNPVSYWFAANGRRFVVVEKISTVYESAYCGLFLPYALPINYPLPLVCVGSRTGQLPGDPTLTWRDASLSHSDLLLPVTNGSDGTGGTSGLNPSGMMLDPLGIWVPLDGGGSERHASVFPVNPGNFQFGNLQYQFLTGNLVLGVASALGLVNPGFDGAYPLIPLHLATSSPQQAPPYENELWGVFDGVYWVPGAGNAVENTITVGTLAHLVVQNVFRTTNLDYFALAQA